MSADNRAAPLVSVVIPNYNGMAWLPGCLDSLAAQGMREGDLEICVVDDASADGSAAWLRERHPQVRLAIHERNTGFAVTANDGIRMAKGEWVFLLNNDTVVRPDCLKNAFAHINAHPETDWIACQLRLMQHPDLLDSAGDCLTIAGFARARGKYLPADTFCSAPEPVFGGCAAAILVRRKVFDEVGLFEESFTSYIEDIDWSFRANLRGHRCMLLPQCQVLHRMSATTGRGSAYLTRHTSRNVCAMWLRCAPWPILLASLPPHLFATALQGLLYCTGGTFGDFARGKLDFLCRLPSILRARNVIQSRRILSLGEMCGRLEWHWFRTLILDRLRHRAPAEEPSGHQ